MKNIPYCQWEKLSEANQNTNITLGRLPEVPLADLENGLTMSRMIVKDGERFWEIQRKGNTQTHIFPEYKEKTVSGITMRSRFNPVRGDYKMKLPPSEALLMDSVDFGDSHWNIWTVGGD